MAAAEAGVEGVCVSRRLGGSLYRQEAASSPRVAEGLFIVSPGPGERPGERVEGPGGRRMGQGASGGDGLHEGSRPGGPWPSKGLPLGNIGATSVSGSWAVLPFVVVCALRRPPPLFLTEVGAVCVAGDVHDTIWGWVGSLSRVRWGVCTRRGCWEVWTAIFGVSSALFQS